MLTDLADVCRTSGLNVVEVEGCLTRGYAGLSLRGVRAVFHHHTATGRSAFLRSDAPTLGLCVNGRSDLPGPLCHLVLGRSGTVYVVAAGLANHAGVGSYLNIPVNEGNLWAIGIEVETSGVEPWDLTPEQIDALPRLGAALERAYMQDLPPELRLQIGHKEYSSAGKIDLAGFPGDMDGLRASINQALDGINTQGGGTKPIEEDDIMSMTPAQLDAFAQKIADKCAVEVAANANLKNNSAWHNMTHIKLDEANLQIAALAKVIADGHDGLSVDDVRETLRQAVADSLGSFEFKRAEVSGVEEPQP